MAALVLRRVGSAAVVLVLLVLVVFAFQQTSHADPVKADLGPSAPQELVDAERARLGYDDPLAARFVRYLGDVIHGDLGDSLRTNQPVADDLRRTLPASLELIGGAMLLAVLAGMALGVATAREGSRAGLTRVAMTLATSVPGFLLATLGVLVFYRQLGWLPASGRTSHTDAPTGPTGFLTLDAALDGRLDVFGDALRHLVLPAAALAVAPAVAIARVLRSGLLATLGSDHVRTARAKGLPERTVITRHALRNSSGPAVSLAGLLLASLFAGAVIVEQIVAWPGIGAYMLRSTTASDYPAIAGVTIVVGSVYVATNAAAEIAQAVIDPRLRTA